MDSVREVAAGSIAGACGKFVAYPFDTVKVRMQMAGPAAAEGGRASAAACVAGIIRAEGPRGFFRGLSAPIAGAAFENAILFWGFALGLRGFCAVAGGDPHAKAPPLTAVAAAGLAAGSAAAIVNTPVELLKCTMQVEHLKPVAERQYAGVVDVARQMVRKEGFGSLYAGFSATVLREGPGTAAWFVTYNALVRAMLKEGQSRADLPAHKLVAAGGFGGMAYWALLYPVDVVKTKMQLCPQHRRLGFARAFGRAYAAGGVGGLYAGLGVTLIRAFPSNGVIFLVYENATRVWDNAFGVKH